MSRSWNDKQSAALIGKWYAYRAMGYELLFIHAEESGRSIEIEYKFEKEGLMESMELRAPRNSTLPSIMGIFPAGEYIQKEICHTLPIQFDNHSYEEDHKIGVSHVTWGPFHRLLPEPVQFQILMKDEVLDKVWIQTGYNRRGIEKLCMGRKAEEVLEVLERTTAMNGVPLCLAFLHALEEINGIEVPQKAQWLRLVLNEMSSFHANLHALNHTAQCLGLLSDSARIFKWIGFYQEAAALISKHPFLFHFLRVGGISCDIPRDILYSINAILQEIEKELLSMKAKWQNTASVEKRMKAIGVVDIDLASKTHGRIARAAGFEKDSRKNSKLPYSSLSYHIPVEKGSHCYGRIMLKFDDLLQSLNLIDQVIETLPKGEVLNSVKLSGDGQAFVRESEANGELLLLLKQEEGKVASVKIRNATALHFPLLPLSLAGMELTDLPLLVSSFDLDLSGMEK